MNSLKRFIKRAALRAHRFLSNKINRDAFYSQTSTWMNERPIEYAFLFRAVHKTCPSTILDIGTGKTSLPALLRTCGPIITATDNVVDYWAKGMFNPHYYVIHDNILNSKIRDRFDLISCISVLEHIRDHEDAIRSMFNLLNQEGHIVLTCPYNENNYVGNVYKLEGAGYGRGFSYIGQVFSRDEINRWIEQNGARIVEQQYWKFFSGEYWTFGERVLPPEQTKKDQLHQLTCLLLQRESR